MFEGSNAGDQGLPGAESSGTLSPGTDASTQETLSDQGFSAEQAVVSGASGDQLGSGKQQVPAGWEKILEPIPSQFHSVVTPVLKEWDKNYEALAQKYSRYKDFDQKGVDPTHLQNGLELYNLLSTNPQEVYRRLGTLLGVEGQIPDQQQYQPEMEDSYQEEVEDSDNPYAQQMQQMRQQMDQVAQYLQHQQQMQQQEQMQQQQDALTQRYEQQIDSEIKQIQSKNPNVNIEDLMTRYLAQIQRGIEPSISKAYEEQQAFVQQYMQGTGKTAPKVLSPGGGIPSNQEQISLKTTDDRVAAVKAMLRASQP